jgi:hypothetical protein
LDIGWADRDYKKAGKIDMASKLNQSHFKRDSSFFQVHADWFDSTAYRNLSLTARCLLEEFMFVYLPGRNGHLVLSVEQAAVRLNTSEETARKAYHELMEKGFLVLSEEANYLNGRAREFRLTVFPSNNGREPSDDWKNWSPDNPIVKLK